MACYRRPRRIFVGDKLYPWRIGTVALCCTCAGVAHPRIVRPVPSALFLSFILRPSPVQLGPSLVVPNLVRFPSCIPIFYLVHMDICLLLTPEPESWTFSVYSVSLFET